MYISLNTFFTGILYLLGIIALVMLILVLFKINSFVTNLISFFDRNRDKLQTTCNSLPQISENIIEITDNVKDISEVATEFTADAIVAKESFFNNYDILKDILKIIKSVFLK